MQCSNGNNHTPTSLMVGECFHIQVNKSYTHNIIYTTSSHRSHGTSWTLVGNTDERIRYIPTIYVCNMDIPYLTRSLVLGKRGVGHSNEELRSKITACSLNSHLSNVWIYESCHNIYTVSLAPKSLSIVKFYEHRMTYVQTNGIMKFHEQCMHHHTCNMMYHHKRDVNKYCYQPGQLLWRLNH